MSGAVVKPEKFILDATAGFREMWFDKHHKNVVYLDKRPECEPSLIGDFRDLSQFSDERFKLIIFDPPHIVLKNIVNASTMVRKFGCLQAETWRDDLKKGFNELWRVLAPYGVLLLKWNNVFVSSDKVLELLPQKPLIYQNFHKPSKNEFQKNSRRMQTTWFTFMKFPSEAKS